MAKASRVIKLSKNMRPFVSRVIRNGKQQKAFKEAARACGAVTGVAKSKVTSGEIGRCIGNKLRR